MSACGCCSAARASGGWARSFDVAACSRKVVHRRWPARWALDYILVLPTTSVARRLGGGERRPAPAAPQPSPSRSGACRGCCCAGGDGDGRSTCSGRELGGASPRSARRRTQAGRQPVQRKFEESVAIRTEPADHAPAGVRMAAFTDRARQRDSRHQDRHRLVAVAAGPVVAPRIGPGWSSFAISNLLYTRATRRDEVSC